MVGRFTRGALTTWDAGVAVATSLKMLLTAITRLFAPVTSWLGRRDQNVPRLGAPAPLQRTGERLDQIAVNVVAFHQTPEYAPILPGETGRLSHIARRSTQHVLDITPLEGCNCPGPGLERGYRSEEHT